MSCANQSNYDIGDSISLHGDFINPNTKAYSDPLGQISVTVRNSTGVESKYIYGIDPEVLKVTTGRYLAVVIPNESGTWTYRWSSLGAAQEERQFYVKEGIVTSPESPVYLSDDIPATLGVGRSLLLTGNQDYVDFGSNSQLSNDMTLQVNWSMSLWMKTNSIDTNRRIVFFHWNAITNWNIFQSSDGTLNFEISDINNAEGIGNFDQSTVMSEGIWYHVVMAFDGSQVINGDRLKVYIDGTDIPLNFVNSFPPALSEFLFAGNFAFSDRSLVTNFDGNLDDVRCYAKTLTQQEAVYLYTNGVSGINPGTETLKAYWSFDYNLQDTVSTNDGVYVA